MKKVREFIYNDISCVHEDSNLERVIKTMKLHRISAVPIVNHNGHYIGCISEQDILSAAVPLYMKSIQNTSFMHNFDKITGHLSSILHEKAIDYVDTEYPFVSPDDSMSYAADLLYRKKGTVLPVVEGKLLLGLITRIEILSTTLKD